MSENIVRLHLKRHQINKLVKGMGIQVSHNHLTASGGDAGYVDFELPDKFIKKMAKNFQSNKQIRIPKHIIEGGRFNLIKAIKRVVTKVKQGFQKLGDDIKPALPTLKKIGIQATKIIVPKLASMGAMALTGANPIAGAVAGTATGLALNKLLEGQGLKKGVATNFLNYQPIGKPKPTQVKHFGQLVEQHGEGFNDFHQPKRAHMTVKKITGGTLRRGIPVRHFTGGSFAGNGYS